MLKTPSSRAPSPTPTAFSGISNYRTTDSHRRDTKGAPPVPTIDYRQVSKVHYGELGKYLANYLARAPPNSRSTARSKLTRLTIQQFHELSTDVYDELVRRQNEKEVPFLPVREDFHPKRNQARQKLATLPSSRFEDLSSDVYFELARRYPEFKEDPSGGRRSASSNYDDYPAPDFGTGSASTPARNNSRTSGRQSADRPSDTGYGSASSARKPSIGGRRPSESEFSSGRRSEDAFRRPDDIYGGREESFSAALASRKKPSQDIPRRSDDRERDRPDYGSIGRRPSQATSTTDSSGTTTTQPPQPSTTATSAMIIPNKSTIEEEYIDIPYGRDGRDSGTVDGDRSAGLHGDDSASEYPSPGLGTRSPPGGLSGLAARLRGVEDEDDSFPANRSGDDMMDRYGRTSVESRLTGGRGSAMNEDIEKMKSDYEYKIATMQTQISSLQRDLSNAQEDGRRQRESEMRASQLEDELESLRQRAEEQSVTMRAMQKELEDLRMTRERERLQAEDDREELKIFQDRCNKLEEEFEMRQGGGAADTEAIEQLRADMQGLLTEVEELSRRNDELMHGKDADNVLIRDLDNQMKEYKRKYEQAKTELRSVKATSQLFLQAPKMAEDQLPVTADGGVLDIHVTAFLSAVDSLLTAGRSSAPTRVLTPMKAVVNAVTNIIDDVKAYERRPQRDRADLDLDSLRLLRDRAEATLTNLVAASKTHASASGMSPVSLLDAAASHVSATVTEIGRTIFIRKATKAEQEQASYGYNGQSSLNGFSPALRAVEERPGHQRKSSQASISSRGGRLTDSPRGYMRRPQSDNSSSEQTSSPPPIFDTAGPSGGMISDDSAPAESSEDAWTEVKPYLEAQTESIVYAIQAVLSGVRSPTLSPTLNENLTQIITIVSSIVAVCKDNLPQATAQQGAEILRELDEHANKLSEVQALAETTKESRQTMAKSSFAIANAMKGLMKL